MADYKSTSFGKPADAGIAGGASAAAIALALLTGGPVWASDDPGEAQWTLEQIIVEARKREERLLETPIAVTAVSEAELDRRNVRDLSGISDLVPNMVFDRGTGTTGSSSNAQIFIRGIGQQDFLFTVDPGVGLYIDGVFFPRGTGVVMDLVDLRQVEVLRGPQGTLFGKNTIGGAIIVSSKKPDDDLGGLGRVTVGSRDRIDGQIAVNLPIVEDRLALRIAGSTRNQDGFVERINAGDDMGDTNSLFGRLQLRWTPSETWTVELAADATRKREASLAEELVDVRPEDPSNALLGLWNAIVAPALEPGLQMDRRFLSAAFETQATGPNFSDFDMFGLSLTIDKTINENLSVKSITAYRDQDSQFAGDTDHSPFRFTESNNDNEHEMVSQEIQLTGASFGGRLEWVFGGFYLHEEGSDLFEVFLGSGLFDALEMLPAPLIPLAPGVMCPPPPGVFLPCVGGPGNPLNVALDLDVLITDHIDINSYAVFGEANFDITDKLNATVGLRYTYDEKTFTTSLLRLNSGVPAVPETSVGDNWDRLSPRFGLKYTLRENAMIYASVTGGFKSGGFNGRALSLAEVDSFNPERVWAYEVGAKLAFPEHRFGVNVAAFYNDYKDMQLLSVRDVDGVIVAVTENAGEVEIKGFEVELFASPADGLNLRGGLGYLDSGYKELAPTATVSLDDLLVNAPEWTANAAFDYTITLGNDGAVTFGGDLTYRSRYANELTNEPMLIQDGFALLGAFITYTHSGGRWSLTAFGTNLTDERYMTNGLTSFGSFGNAVANFAPPREWGLKLQAEF